METPPATNFGKNGLQETWTFYQETQGPKDLEHLAEDERQVPVNNIWTCVTCVRCIHTLQHGISMHQACCSSAQGVLDLIAAAADGNVRILEELLNQAAIAKHINITDDGNRCSNNTFLHDNPAALSCRMRCGMMS